MYWKRSLSAIALVALAGGTPLAKAEGVRAGAAAVVITPAAGTPMAGYYHARAAEGVHDDLRAKALVIEADGKKVALVALDLISTTRDLVEEARHEVEAATGIPGGNVMISATHAHTGPVIRGRGERDVSLGGDSGPAVDFRKGLPGKIARAVQQADAALVPARLSVAHGAESSIAFNRRFHMIDGSVGWNPGKLNPRIVKPAGPIDPDVPVILAETADGKTPIAVYVNYAVHLDNVGGPMISADMPHTLSKSLGEFLGPEAVTLFTAGCCGDINHVNVNWSAPQKGSGNAARMGVILAGEVLRTWPNLAEVKPGALRVKSATVALDLPELEPGDIEKAREIVERLRAGEKANVPKFLEQVWAYKTLDVAARQGKPQAVEVQVIALGDQVAWVSLPGEIFVDLGLAIKQDSPFPHTVIAELANGAIGYIPSGRAYTQGNYEVVSARCARGSGERLVDAAVKLLKELHGEATGGTVTASRVRD